MEIVDKNKLVGLLGSADTRTETVMSIVNELLPKYTKPLDDLMGRIYAGLHADNPITDDELEASYLELTNLLYFMAPKMERLGVAAELAKSRNKEVYNEAYLSGQSASDDPKKKATVAELTARAEGAAQYDSTVSSVYATVYSGVKYRVEAAEEMVHALSKVLSKRMAEKQLGNTPAPKTVDGKRVLLENASYDF